MDSTTNTIHTREDEKQSLSSHSIHTNKFKNCLLWRLNCLIMSWARPILRNRKITLYAVANNRRAKAIPAVKSFLLFIYLKSGCCERIQYIAFFFCYCLSKKNCIWVRSGWANIWGTTAVMYTRLGILVCTKQFAIQFNFPSSCQLFFDSHCTLHFIHIL